MDAQPGGRTLRLGEVDHIFAMEPPQLVPVDSSAICALGYDDVSRTLFVRFRSGALYAYLRTPPETARAFMAAPSKGRFFAERIDSVFRYVRLDAA